MPPPVDPNAPAAGSNAHPNPNAPDRSRAPPPVSSSTRKGDTPLVPLLFHYRYKNFNAGEVAGVPPDEAEGLLKQQVTVNDQTHDVCERYEEKRHGKTLHGRVAVERRRDIRQREEE